MSSRATIRFGTMEGSCDDGDDLCEGSSPRVSDMGPAAIQCAHARYTSASGALS